MTFLRPWAPHISASCAFSQRHIHHSRNDEFFAWPEAFPCPLYGLLLTSARNVWKLSAALLLLIGLFPRPVAFLLSGFMAAAYFMGHATNGFFLVLNGGEPALLFCWVFLYIAAAGPGPIER